jgi:hypothetical protein
MNVQLYLLSIDNSWMQDHFLFFASHYDNTNSDPSNHTRSAVSNFNCKNLLYMKYIFNIIEKLKLLI